MLEAQSCMSCPRSLFANTGPSMKQTLQPRPSRVRRAGLFLLACALAMPGCASITNFAAMRSIPVASATNPVIDLACIWQQGEGRDARGMPSRGFCGQLMFMTAGSKKPAVVQGSVTVYVFDNVGTIEEQTKPFETFEFTAEQWAGFQRRTNLGMTYQLFIPYTRPGGRESECQVHVKFTPVGGSPLFSHPESISMRGSSGAAAMADAIDRKLTSNSLLFQNPTLMKPAASDPAYAELVRKMQADAKTQPGTTPNSAPTAPARKQAVKQSEIERLQAVLNDSTSRRVQHADYSDSGSKRERVMQAVHEEDALE